MIRPDNKSALCWFLNPELTFLTLFTFELRCIWSFSKLKTASSSVTEKGDVKNDSFSDVSKIAEGLLYPGLEKNLRSKLKV